MTLNDVMTKAVVTVDQDADLGRIGELFKEATFHHLLVTEAGKLTGVISDRDFLRNVSPFLGKSRMERTQDLSTLDRKAHQIMTRRPVTARTDTAVADAAQLLLRNRVSCLPVVSNEQRVVGIVTWRDLLRLAYSEAEASKRDAA